MIELLIAAMLAAAVALPAQAERLRGLVPSTVTSSDGLSIAVVESGETTGRPILFVHGFSQSAAAWRRQMLSDLGDSYRLIAFDLRGPLDHSPTLGTIKVPVLFIHGGKDRHVLPRSTEIMKGLVDGARIVGGGKSTRTIYDGIGHAPFIEDAKRFNADLKTFVSGL